MRRFLTVAASLSVGFGSIALAQTSPTQQATRESATAQLGLDKLLARWQEEAVFHNLEVTFSQVNRRAKWGEERYEGKLTLGSAGRSCLETERLTGLARIPVQRLIRNGDQFYQYRFCTKQIITTPSNLRPFRKEQGLASRIQSTLFSFLLRSSYGRGDSLPFLFEFKVADARAAYRMELVKETAEEAVIRFSPLTQAGKSMFDYAIVRLDKTQWFPVEAILIEPGGRDQSTYRFTKFTRNGLVDDDRFEFEALEGWKIVNVGEPHAVKPATIRPIEAREFMIDVQE